MQALSVLIIGMNPITRPLKYAPDVDKKIPATVICVNGLGEILDVIRALIDITGRLRLGSRPLRQKNCHFKHLFLSNKMLYGVSVKPICSQGYESTCLTFKNLTELSNTKVLNRQRQTISNT